MNTNSSRVGKDTLSFCKKCNLTLSHTIVAMADNVTIAKVKCNTCQAIHKYKDPALAKLTKKKTPISQLTKKFAPTFSNIWEEGTKNSSKTAKPYSTKEKFLQGDVIEHPTFGTGVVNGFLDQDKIKVIFKSEEKTLLHNKR